MSFIETLERKEPLKIEPWLSSWTERIFNPAIASWEGRVYLIPRENPPNLPGNSSAGRYGVYTDPDVTEKYGVYTDQGSGSKRTSEIPVRSMFESKGFASMEDWRCGRVLYGESWVGLSLVRDESAGKHKKLIPYAGLVKINLKPGEVRITEFVPLPGIGPGKNTLPLSSKNGVLTIAMRREGRAFDHAISFYDVKISSGKTDHLRDEQIPVAPWCPDRIGLTGLPITLPTELGQKSRQLWILHGVKKTPLGAYDEYEYAIGLGIRTENQRGVNWQVTEQALHTHPQVKEAIEAIGITPEDRDPTKKVIYSTGVLGTNGHTTIALSFGDWATFKVEERTSNLIEAVQKSNLLARAA